MNSNWNDNRHNMERRFEDEMNRQRNMGRNRDPENYYPHPAMDDHYRMYRDWNDSSHYGNRGIETHPDNGRTGYMEYNTRDENSRQHISAYGYRNVGDRTNYGHSGTNDPYDPRYYDRGRNMYGMGADAYMNGRRDEEMRYDSRNDWYRHGRGTDPERSRNYRDDNLGRIHYDVGMNERNTSTWTGDQHMFGQHEDQDSWENRRR